MTGRSEQGGGAIGFEETEEIGPDGKPHIISEHSFTPGAGKPLTAAQKKQQELMDQHMQAMTRDMAQMFSNGDFFGPGNPPSHKLQYLRSAYCLTSFAQASKPPSTKLFLYFDIVFF